MNNRSQTDECFLSAQTVYHWQRVLVVEHAVDVVDDLSGVVVGDLARPARPDALGAVHQHQWNDGNVPLGLHLLVVVVQELEQVGIHRWEQQLGKRTVGNESAIIRLCINVLKEDDSVIWQEIKPLCLCVALPEHGEDVTRAGSIFASVDASTELTQWLQYVHIVTAHKVLGQVHDGHHESLLQGQREGMGGQQLGVLQRIRTITVTCRLYLSVMVGRHLCH